MCKGKTPGCTVGGFMGLAKIFIDVLPDRRRSGMLKVGFL